MASIEAIVRGAPEIAFEVFAFGRVPLAISARCSHARIKGLTKDNCQFVCGEDPDGLEVETLDGQRFLALNGVQTVSSTCQSLIADVPALMGRRRQLAAALAAGLRHGRGGAAVPRRRRRAARAG